MSEANGNSLHSLVGLPPVLDACCGGRMIWFNKADERALFVDKRSQCFTYRNGDKKKDYLIDVAPDRQADFTDLPFPSGAFALVVFDPPHFSNVGDTSFTAKKYGKLPSNWRDMLRKGFAECFRVLRPDGVLVFKWSEYEIPVRDVLTLTPEKPLFGNRYGKAALSHWIVFMKPNSALCVKTHSQETRCESRTRGGLNL